MTRTAARKSPKRTKSKGIRKWEGWAKVSGWIGNPDLWEHIWPAVRRIAGSRYSEATLWSLYVSARIRHNAVTPGTIQTKDTPKIQRWADLSVVELAAGAGVSRKAAGVGLRALVKAGLLLETDDKRHWGRTLYRPRPVSHDRMVAYAAYLQAHDRFPPSEWWDRPTLEVSQDFPQPSLVGQNDTPPVSNGPTPRVKMTHGVGQNDTPQRANIASDKRSRRLRSFQEKEEEKKSVTTVMDEETSVEESSSPTPLGASAPTPGHHDTDEDPEAAPYLGVDGMGAACLDCHRPLDIRTVAHIRRRMEADEDDVAWTHSAGPMGRCP